MSGLEQEFPHRLRAVNEDATTDEAKAEIAELDFANHGLVIRDRQGEVVFKQPDHHVDLEAVRSWLREQGAGDG